MTHPIFQKNKTMPLLLQKHQKKTVQEREKNRNTKTNQKVTLNYYINYKSGCTS